MARSHDSAVRGAGRLLHDRALPAGQGQRPVAGRAPGFDDDHLAAAGGGPAQADGDARLPDPVEDLQVRVGGCAEHAGDGLRGDLDRGQVALGTAAHQLGAHGAERGGQPPDPGLARVAANEGRDRLAGHLHLLGRQPVAIELQRQEVLGRHDPLVVLGVRLQFDGREVFTQHRRHGGDAGGRGDEADLGQVEGDVEIAVAEGGVGVDACSGPIHPRRRRRAPVFGDPFLVEVPRVVATGRPARVRNRGGGVVVYGP